MVFFVVQLIKGARDGVREKDSEFNIMLYFYYIFLFCLLHKLNKHISQLCNA